MYCIMDALHNDIHNEDRVRVLCEGQIMMRWRWSSSEVTMAITMLPATVWTVNGFGRTLPKIGPTNLYATNWIPTAQHFCSRRRKI